MYPYITLGETKIYMTWLGIIFSLLLFIILVWYYSRKYRLKFHTFFYSIPVLLLLTYLCGSYVEFVFHSWSFLPSTSQDLIRLFSPHDYTFHYAWVIVWFFCYLLRFIHKRKHSIEKKKRIDVLFFSTALSFIPLGFFLLLGNEFMGEATEAIRWIKWLHPESEIKRFGNKVHPIGLFLSLTGIVSSLVSLIVYQTKKKYGVWYLWFALLLWGMSIIFFYQNYPMHGVIKVAAFRVDIKHYVSWFLLLITILLFRKSQKSS